VIDLIEAFLNVQLQDPLFLALGPAVQVAEQLLLGIVGGAGQGGSVAIGIEIGFVSRFNRVLGQTLPASVSYCGHLERLCTTILFRDRYVPP